MNDANILITSKKAEEKTRKYTSQKKYRTKTRKQEKRMLFHYKSTTLRNNEKVLTYSNILAVVVMK